MAERRIEDVRRNGLTIIQSGVAAAVAFFVAQKVVGHPHPFFAPVAAVLTLSLAVGRRGRRAVEVAVGVAVGIGVADLIVLGIGTGAWQLGVVVALAMSAALLVGGSTLLVNQAAVSGVLVATLQLPGTGLSGARFIDALVGGSVALLANALAPTDPVRLVRRELAPLLSELAGALDDVREALENSDHGRAEEALARGRAIDPLVVRFREALDAGRDMVRMSPARRSAKGRLDQFTVAADPIDFAVRNSRVLARGSIRAIELGEHVPPRTLVAISDLAEAVRGLDDFLADPLSSSAARDHARHAASEATAALEETSNLAVSVIVGQVRSTATDILRGLGDDTSDAIRTVRDPYAGASTSDVTGERGPAL